MPEASTFRGASLPRLELERGRLARAERAISYRQLPLDVRTTSTIAADSVVESMTRGALAGLLVLRSPAEIVRALPPESGHRLLPADVTRSSSTLPLYWWDRHCSRSIVSGAPMP